MATLRATVRAPKSEPRRSWVRRSAAGGNDAVLVDCAGAAAGGSKRFLEQLDRWLDRDEERLQIVHIVGRNRALDPAWLLRRERPRSRGRVIALNNVSFVASGVERSVLLRNAAHFLRPDEEADLRRAIPLAMRIQTTVVRTAARCADRVIVPTEGMADRVRQFLPDVCDRLEVRHHPLAQPAAPGRREQASTFLCPIVFSRWKSLGPVLTEVDTAARKVSCDLQTDVRIDVTASLVEAAAYSLPLSPRLRYVGRLSSQAMAAEQSVCAGMIYPTRVESFGYPLAEARLLRIPVVASGTRQNLEVAGDCLVPYAKLTADELAQAMTTALQLSLPASSHNPFDPDRYFPWLLRL